MKDAPAGSERVQRREDDEYSLAARAVDVDPVDHAHTRDPRREVVRRVDLLAHLTRCGSSRSGASWRWSGTRSAFAFVTHRLIGDAEVPRAAEVVAAVVTERATGSRVKAPQRPSRVPAFVKRSCLPTLFAVTPRCSNRSRRGSSCCLRTKGGCLRRRRRTCPDRNRRASR